MCDGCKMLIKDELTQPLDRYNGTKLKRMYKLMDQDMLQMYKLRLIYFWVFCEVKGEMFVIVNR